MYQALNRKSCRRYIQYHMLVIWDTKRHSGKYSRISIGQITHWRFEILSTAVRSDNRKRVSTVSQLVCWNL